MALFTEKEQEKSCTILGENTFFQGVLKFSDELEIAGKFEGVINATGALHIRKTSVCQVDYIQAASIVVDGSVTGNLRAGDKIELRPGSAVHGDLSASSLKMADDVSFEGKVAMLKGKNDTDIFLTRPDVLKNHLRNED